MNKTKALDILLVDDETIIHQTIGDYLTSCGHKIDSKYRGGEALEAVNKKEYDLALVDLKIPDVHGLNLMKEIQKICPLIPIIIITGHGTLESAIEALRQGAADFLTKPIKLIELDAVLEKSVYFRSLQAEKRRLQEVIEFVQHSFSERQAYSSFVGVSKTVQKVRRQISQAAETNCDTVLILGETGTGKEVVAHQIHQQSFARHSPFIAISCPNLSETLLESEMFGYCRGAFTGAHSDKAGYLELADGGTLFLDEIGDLSPSAQTRLLRVLETRSVRRIGGTKEIPLNIRIIAATNADLEQRLQNGLFRKDLFYRLNLYLIEIPPLKSHLEDIPALAEYFLRNYRERRKIKYSGFSSTAIEMLLNYKYPGNVRELRNIVERAAILQQSGVIQAEHIQLPPFTRDKPSANPNKETENGEYYRIRSALEEAKWNRRLAARILDIPYSTLRYKIEKLKIK